MSVLTTLLSQLDITTIIIFLLVFLLAFYWFTIPSNLPPGPRALPVVGNVLALKDAGPNILDLMHKWHVQYGDIFTIKMGNKYMIVINSYKVVHEAFVKQSDIFSSRPTNLFHTSRQVVAATGIGVIFSDGPQWKELRRVTLMTLRDFGVGKKSLEQRIHEEGGAIMEVLDKSEGRPLKLKQLLPKFSANIICSLVLGERFSYDDPTFLELTRLVNLALMQPVLFSITNIIPILRFIPTVKAKVDKMVSYSKSIDQLLEKILREHEKTFDPDAEIRDFVDLYLKTRSETRDTHVYNAANMRRVILDLLLAGTDTTSSTLEWLLLYLVAYPDVQKRCQEEIDKTIGRERLVTMEDRKNLPYIEAVITEILRLTPAAPFGVQHVAVSEAKLAGYTVPAESIVMSNILEINRNPDAWPEPGLFKPERFLDKSGQFCPPKEEFASFSVGPRTCLGEVLARMELFLLFTTLMQFFTFRMGEGCKPDLEGHMGITLSAKEQPIFASRRH